MIVIISTHVCFFSDWVNDSNLQNEFGYSIIASISFFIFINAIPIAQNQVNTLRKIFLMLKFDVNNKLAERWPGKFKKIISLKSLKNL